MTAIEIHHVKPGVYRISARSKILESPEAQANVKAFLGDLSELVDALDSLLGIKKLSGKERRQSLILKRVQRVVDLFNAKDDSARIEFSALGLFTKQLQSLKDNHKKSYGKLTKKILKQHRNIAWEGLKSEVAVASCLVDFLGDDFVIRESPDYEFKFLGEKVYIEVTSARLLASREGDVTYKISAAASSKNRKPYARNDVALFIDITNIMHHYFSNPNNNPEELWSSVNKKFEELNLKFGAVVLTANGINYELSRYEMKHSVMIMGHCSVALAEFINRYFPEPSAGTVDHCFLVES